MSKDYRNTKYCEPLSQLADKKQKVVNDIVKEHRRARDMHKYISTNNSKHKTEFMKAYNWKCSYCGVSIEIIPRHMFEIDHFIYLKAQCFGGSKAAAGYIENLVLSCHNCNHSKNSLELPENMHKYLHPDSPKITETFIRDENYYIKISDKMKDNPTVIEFYEQLNLGNELHRIDYLLMNMKWLYNNLKDKHSNCSKLIEAIDLLHTRRNAMG